MRSLQAQEYLTRRRAEHLPAKTKKIFENVVSPSQLSKIAFIRSLWSTKKNVKRHHTKILPLIEDLQMKTIFTL